MASPESSSLRSGGKRGSSVAAARAIAATVSASEPRGVKVPMQPRRAPSTVRVTKAPRGCASGPTVGRAGAGAPPRRFNTVPRAIPRSAARSATPSGAGSFMGKGGLR
jgi:hypothetical protein